MLMAFVTTALRIARHVTATETLTTSPLDNASGVPRPSRPLATNYKFTTPLVDTHGAGGP